MATEIKVWQIHNGGLKPLESTMAEAGRTESQDLEWWIKSNPDILGQDILIIGEQVQTGSGPLDLLGVDRLGNTVIIELKRGRIPREALAQAIDYASDVASWDFDRLNDACVRYSGKLLDEYITDSLDDVDLENLSLGQAQRILLVGTSIEESLERMIEWLSGSYGVSINAAIFKYIQTNGGDELLARTMIIPEETERERSQTRQRRIEMDDTPGAYEPSALEDLLRRYLSEDRVTPGRIRNVLLPLCLDNEVATRDMIKRELVNRGEADDEGKAGTILTTISRELGIRRRDYLRQVVRYDKTGPQEKDNYRIEDEHEDMVRRVLDSL